MMRDLEECDANLVNNNPVTCTKPNTVYDAYTRMCVSAQIVQFEDQEHEILMQFIYGIILPFLAVVVVISNSIVIVVLSQKNTKRTSIEPLLWMAVCSLLMSLSPLPFTIYYYNLGHYQDLHQTLFLCYLQKVCMEILPFFFNLMVTLFTIMLGIQRFVVVQYPLESMSWCAPRMLRRFTHIIVATASFLTLFHSIYDVRLLYHFCFQITRDGPREVQKMLKHDNSKSYWVPRCFIGYSDFTLEMGAETFASIFDYFRIFMVVSSSGLLLVVTALLIQTIRTHDNEKQGVHRHKNRKNSNHTTIMLTVIILIYMLARLPSTLLIILMKVMDHTAVPQLAIEIVNNVYLRVLANITVISLHPISFAVYMLMSRKFRVSLRRLLGWRFFASDDDMLAFNSSIRVHTSHHKMSTVDNDALCGVRMPLTGNRTPREVRRGMSVDLQMSLKMDPSQKRRRGTTAADNNNTILRNNIGYRLIRKEEGEEEDS